MQNELRRGGPPKCVLGRSIGRAHVRRCCVVSTFRVFVRPLHSNIQLEVRMRELLYQVQDDLRHSLTLSFVECPPHLEERGESVEDWPHRWSSCRGVVDAVGTHGFDSCYLSVFHEAWLIRNDIEAKRYMQGMSRID